MFINLFVEKWRNFAREKKTLDRRTRQVSTKANCETRETLGQQSAERSVGVSGQGGRGSYSARRLSAGCGGAESWDFLGSCT
jgi:hypothetical protein